MGSWHRVGGRLVKNNTTLEQGLALGIKDQMATRLISGIYKVSHLYRKFFRTLHVYIGSNKENARGSPPPSPKMCEGGPGVLFT